MFPNKEQAEAYHFLMSRIPRLPVTFGSWLMKKIMMLSVLMPIALFLGNMYFPENQWEIKNYTIAFSSIYFVVMLIGLVFSVLVYTVMNFEPKMWVQSKEKTLKGAPKQITPVVASVIFTNPNFLLLLCSGVAVGMNGLVAFSGWILVVAIVLKIMVVKIINAEITLVGQAIIDKRFKPHKFSFIG